MKNEKKKHYLFKSIAYRTTGIFIIFLAIVSSFFIYETKINWSNFKGDIKDFVLVQENTLKLNPFISLFVIIGSLVFAIIVLKKSKEFFKNRISMGTFITLLILYGVYSVIEVVLIVMAGAFIGIVIDEFLFMPLSAMYKRKHAIYKDTKEEFSKEKERIRARREYEGEINGSV